MPTSTQPRRKTPTKNDRLAARVEAENVKAAENLQKLRDSTTQREWLNIRRALNMTRAQISAEIPLDLLAMAYVKELRDHGAASWDVLLDMTDDQIATLLGFVDEDDLKARDAAAEAPAADE